MPGMPNPFCIGSDTWPGLSKLAEESGELVQVLGKLIATGGGEQHWDGSNLVLRQQEEIGDVLAAIDFYIMVNRPLSKPAIEQRRVDKFALFCRWHNEQQEEVHGDRSG